jgi:lysophospholipase L1-like esterase
MEARLPRVARWSRVARGLCLAAVATVASLLCAEAAVRALVPAPKTSDLRMLLPDGSAAPMAEALHYLYHYGERERQAEGPRGRLPASMTQRIAYDRPDWDYFDSDGAVVYSTNSLGFRDEEFAVEPTDGELRILALGDSFTFGLGVSLELAWPQVLESSLRADLGPRPVEVIVGGWPNTAPQDYAAWFAADGVAFRPDIVVLGLCLNDMAPVPMLAFPAPEIEAPWLGGVSSLATRVQRALAARRAREAAVVDHGTSLDVDPKPWEACRAGILAIRAAAEAAGARFALAILPMMSGLGDRYPYARMHAEAARFAVENGIECVDLLPEFDGVADEDVQVHQLDQHPNHVGHARIARGVRAFLDANGWLR